MRNNERMIKTAYMIFVIGMLAVASRPITK
jgi:hypothetical protein